MTFFRICILFSFLVFSSKAFAFYNGSYGYDGLTSLMQASAAKDAEGVSFFAKMRPQEINRQNIGGATALHIAARDNSVVIAKTLLDHGADVDLLDNEGYNPAMRAASFGNAAIFKMIMEKNPEISVQNSNSESLIVISAISSCDDCLKGVLAKVVPDYNFDSRDLKSQLSKAYLIASFKENESQKKMLSDFLDKMTKERAPFKVKVGNDLPTIIKKKEPVSKRYILKKTESGALPKVLRSKKIKIEVRGVVTEFVTQKPEKKEGEVQKKVTNYRLVSPNPSKTEKAPLKEVESEVIEENFDLGDDSDVSAVKGVEYRLVSPEDGPVASKEVEGVSQKVYKLKVPSEHIPSSEPSSLGVIRE